jgi:hypothetical protein
MRTTDHPSQRKIFFGDDASNKMLVGFCSKGTSCHGSAVLRHAPSSRLDLILLLGTKKQGRKSGCNVSLNGYHRPRQSCRARIALQNFCGVKAMQTRMFCHNHVCLAPCFPMAKASGCKAVFDGIFLGPAVHTKIYYQAQPI